MAYFLTLPYTEFQKNMCDDIMTAKFNPFVDEEGNITIEYKYGNTKNAKTVLQFRIPGLGRDKVFSVRYDGSSPFAMWWSKYSDEE